MIINNNNDKISYHIVGYIYQEIGNITMPSHYAPPPQLVCSYTIAKKKIPLIINASSKQRITKKHSVQEDPEHLEKHI